MYKKQGEIDTLISFIRTMMKFEQLFQISNLTQSVANLETQLRQQIEQRHRAEADLMAVRDLCVKLDQQKDTLMEQLGDKDTVKTHVNLLTPFCSFPISFMCTFYLLSLIY